MFFSVGNNPTDHFNAWLKLLMFTRKPDEVYKNMSKYDVFNVFFLNVGNFVKLDGSDHDIAYHTSPLNYTADDITLKDDFTIPHSMWYNAGVYAWLMVIMIIASLFVPLEVIDMVVILLGGTIGLVAVYVFNRYRLKRHFQRIAKRIITYHERITMVPYIRRSVYGNNHQRGSVAFYLKNLGIDINETHNY